MPDVSRPVPDVAVDADGRVSARDASGQWVPAARRNDVAEDALPAQPRILAYTATSGVSVGSSWLTIPAVLDTQVSPFAVDSFPGTRWDDSTHTFLPAPNVTEDRNYQVQVLLSLSGGLLPWALDFRVIFPDSDPLVSFPFERGKGHIRLLEASVTGHDVAYRQNVYMGSLGRVAGMRFQIRNPRHTLPGLTLDDAQIWITP